MITNQVLCHLTMEAKLCALGEIRIRTVWLLRPLLLPIGLPGLYNLYKTQPCPRIRL